MQLDKHYPIAPLSLTLSLTHPSAYANLPACVLACAYLPAYACVRACVQEDKLETEYKKIMGTYRPGASSVAPREFPLSAMVTRVHVRDGHCISMSLKLKKPATPEQVTAALRSFVPSQGQLVGLPSAPESFIEVNAHAHAVCDAACTSHDYARHPRA